MDISTETKVLKLSTNDARLDTTVAELCDLQACDRYRLASTFLLAGSLWLIFQRWE